MILITTYIKSFQHHVPINFNFFNLPQVVQGLLYFSLITAVIALEEGLDGRNL